MEVVDRNVVEVKLTRGLVAIIDEEDAERVCQYKWTAKQGQGTNYAHRGINGTSITLHRFILSAKRGEMIDHVNGNGLDNRKANLRFCSNGQNRANSKKQRTGVGYHSVFKGVSWDKGGKRKKRWLATVRHNRKLYVRHCYTELAAARAYDELAREHFGEFAKTNFP